MRFLRYEPRPNAVLTARFLYDPEWVPPELAATPLVVVRFLGAHVLQWDTDPDEDDFYRQSAQAPGGQVTSLDWDGHRLFALDLLTVRVILTAHTVEVATAAPPG